jgi:apolipoprotein D and lipocalin family protein
MPAYLKDMQPLYSWLILAASSISMLGCASTRVPTRTVEHVELSRYMGDWFVIGEIPYFAERSCFDSLEHYSLRLDGGIDNWFNCRHKSFDAPLKRVVTSAVKVLDTHTNAAWRIRTFKVISFQYLVLDLDADYQWVMVGHPSRRYGWIMARSKTLPDSTYQSILDRTRSQGYDPAKFSKVPQRP